jgi:hypothetical protein
MSPAASARHAQFSLPLRPLAVPATESLPATLAARAACTAGPDPFPYRRLTPTPARSSAG